MSGAMSMCWATPNNNHMYECNVIVTGNNHNMVMVGSNALAHCNDTGAQCRHHTTWSYVASPAHAHLAEQVAQAIRQLVQDPEAQEAAVTAARRDLETSLCLVVGYDGYTTYDRAQKGGKFNMVMIRCVGNIPF